MNFKVVFFFFQYSTTQHSTLSAFLWVLLFFLILLVFSSGSCPRQSWPPVHSIPSFCFTFFFFVGALFFNKKSLAHVQMSGNNNLSMWTWSGLRKPNPPIRTGKHASWNWVSGTLEPKIDDHVLRNNAEECDAKFSKLLGVGVDTFATRCSASSDCTRSRTIVRWQKLEHYGGTDFDALRWWAAWSRFSDGPIGSGSFGPGWLLLLSNDGGHGKAFNWFTSPHFDLIIFSPFLVPRFPRHELLFIMLFSVQFICLKFEGGFGIISEPHLFNLVCIYIFLIYFFLCCVPGPV